MHLDKSSTKKENKDCKLKGILSCIGGILIFLSLGSMYTFGNMLPYFASYMTAVNNNLSYSYYLSKCNYIYAFIVCGQSIFFPIGGILGKKYGIKLIIFIGCIIQSIGGVLCTYFYCLNYFYVWITYGILYGIGIGISYPNILVCVMKWYPNNKSFVNGIVLAGFGCSALIFDRIQTAFINPNNLESDPIIGFKNDTEITTNFPYSFLLLGSIYFVMQIVGIFLMQTPPTHYITGSIAINDDNVSEQSPLLFTDNGNSQPCSQQINHDSFNNGFDVIDVFKDIRFYHLYFIFFIDGLIIVFISTQWKIFSNHYLNITDDSFLSLIGSISAIFNGVGRIVFGLIFDKTKSFRYTLGIINVILSFILFLWPYCSNNIMSFIWVCLLFGFCSSNLSIFPTTISNIFGEKNIGINVGLIFSSRVFSAFLGVFVLDELQTIVNNPKYMCFWIASMQLIGAVITFIFPSNNKPNMVKKNNIYDKFVERKL